MMRVNRINLIEGSLKDGFLFLSFNEGEKKDAIVIVDETAPEIEKYPEISNALKKSILEYTTYINQNKISKAIAIISDLSFLSECSTLSSLWIIPSACCKTLDFEAAYGREWDVFRCQNYTIDLQEIKLNIEPVALQQKLKHVKKLEVSLTGSIEPVGADRKWEASLKRNQDYGNDFLFCPIRLSKKSDALVVMSPLACQLEPPQRLFPAPVKELSEYVEYINQNEVKKVIVVSEDVSFIRECPGLEHIEFHAPENAKKIDFAPIYDHRWKYLSVRNYGTYSGRVKFPIDLNRLRYVEKLAVWGRGSILCEKKIDGLRELEILSGRLSPLNLDGITESINLEKVLLSRCKFGPSLSAIGKLSKLKTLEIDTCSQVEDIGALALCAKSLKYLCIVNCLRLQNFDVLYHLEGLEALFLRGEKTIPDVNFLHNMSALKYFEFSMKIKSGDLTPCLDIPHVRCPFPRRSYNIKDKELPKNEEALKSISDELRFIWF